MIHNRLGELLTDRYLLCFCWVTIRLSNLVPVGCWSLMHGWCVTLSQLVAIISIHDGLRLVLGSHSAFKLKPLKQVGWGVYSPLQCSVKTDQTKREKESKSVRVNLTESSL